MLGNLVENAAKYGHGRVFVTVDAPALGMVGIHIEDDGQGILPAQRAELFTRGTRLDTTGSRAPAWPGDRPRRRRDLRR